MIPNLSRDMPGLLSQHIHTARKITRKIHERYFSFPKAPFTFSKSGSSFGEGVCST